MTTEIDGRRIAPELYGAARARSSGTSLLTPRGDPAALGRAVRRYDAAPLLDRLQVRGRALLADLLAIEPQLPRRGTIVDLGCGRGLFANLLVEASAGRDVVGIDPDAGKVAIASLTERPGLRFQVGDAVRSDLPDCDAVAIVDVLYLLSVDDQAASVARATKAVRPGGRVVIYAQERRIDARYWLGYAQERVATGLRLTRGERGLHYSSRDEMCSRLRSCGLAVQTISLPGRPYTDAVYVGVKSP